MRSTLEPAEVPSTQCSGPCITLASPMGDGSRSLALRPRRKEQLCPRVERDLQDPNQGLGLQVQHEHSHQNRLGSGRGAGRGPTAGTLPSSGPSAGPIADCVLGTSCSGCESRPKHPPWQSSSPC